MSNAFTYRMPVGIPGSITRSQNLTVESAVIDPTDYPAAFGVPVVIDGTSRKLRKFKTGDVAADINGFYVRPYPFQAAGTSESIGTTTPPTSGVGNRLRRGYIAVDNKVGTPAAGGKAYVRLTTDTGKAIGDIEAAFVGTITASAITGTGTGTVGSLTVAESAVAGAYRVTLLETSATAAFSVIDPNGNRLKDGNVATAYSAGGVGFTVANGGTMTAGDYYTVTVVHNVTAIPGAKFTGAADTDGTVEIEYNI
jgi:hypothetical protein